MAFPSPFHSDILHGRVALITGGGSGIGFEIALQFGKHGASIAIMGRRKQVLDSAVSALRSLGILAFGFQGDVRKQEDAKKVVEATFEHLGGLDILVNAAAGNFLVSSEDLSPNGFRTVMDIDSVGTFTMCHEALKYLKKGGPGRNSYSGGVIINISATIHYTAGWYQIHVSAAKVVVVLKNLTCGALLSPFEASEEFREGVISVLGQSLQIYVHAQKIHARVNKYLVFQHLQKAEILKVIFTGSRKSQSRKNACLNFSRVDLLQLLLDTGCHFF